MASSAEVRECLDELLRAKEDLYQLRNTAGINPEAEQRRREMTVRSRSEIDRMERVIDGMLAVLWRESVA